jgi:hypothetical protein
VEEIMTDTRTEWADREKALLLQISDEVERYWSYAEKTRRIARATSVISLFCSVLAPVTVVSSAANLSALNISQPTMIGLSVVLTVLLAFVEGLRRIFSFELRWAGAIAALASVKNQRERYLDSQVGKEIGSEEWKANFFATRLAVETAAHVETSEYFKNVLNQSKPRDGDKH